MHQIQYESKTLEKVSQFSSNSMARKNQGHAYSWYHSSLRANLAYQSTKIWGALRHLPAEERERRIFSWVKKFRLRTKNERVVLVIGMVYIHTISPAMSVHPYMSRLSTVIWGLLTWNDYLLPLLDSSALRFYCGIQKGCSSYSVLHL